MPPIIVALIFAALSTIAIWSLVSALRTGAIGSRGWSFSVDDNPLAFLVVFLSHGIIAVFAAAEVLHAVGLIADPLAYLLASLHRVS